MKHYILKQVITGRAVFIIVLRVHAAHERLYRFAFASRPSSIRSTLDGWLKRTEERMERMMTEEYVEGLWSKDMVEELQLVELEKNRMAWRIEKK